MNNFSVTEYILGGMLGGTLSLVAYWLFAKLSGTPRKYTFDRLRSFALMFIWMTIGLSIAVSLGWAHGNYIGAVIWAACHTTTLAIGDFISTRWLNRPMNTLAHYAESPVAHTESRPNSKEDAFRAYPDDPE